MKIRTKKFLILWILAIICTILILPYLLNIQAEALAKANISTSFLILIAIIQGTVIFGLAAFFGLILAEKVGFNLPLLDAWLDHKKINYKKTLFLAIISGAIVGLLIILLDKFLFNQLVIINVPLWQGFLASFYGGIAEEIIMRLFLMTLLVFIILKIFRKKEKNSTIVWISIIFIAILFGLGHLPITSALVSITPFVIFRAILLNGIGGIVFGLLYWKKGLEAAIISHFTADIFIQIIMPLVFR